MAGFRVERWLLLVYNMISGGFFLLSFKYHVMVTCCMFGNYCELVGIIT